MTELKPNYWWAAFNARPLGMPIAPNWFAVAAFGLLGGFINPGFWLLGAGLEIGYLYWLSRNPRFRRAIDASATRKDPAEQRYQALIAQLADTQRQRQQRIEQRAAEIMQQLAASPLMASHADSLEQLVWLHLRLLAAKAAIARVVQTAEQESTTLLAQERQVERRLEDETLSPELRRSLEQQKSVIDARQEAHANAIRRVDHVDAELARIEQQVALIREQTLLAADEDNIGQSLDALTASFNEANRWLAGNRDLLGSLDVDQYQKLPKRVLQRQQVSE